MNMFDAFWAAYPRKREKKDALKAWNALKPDTVYVCRIMALLDQRKREDWKQREAKYLPYPATWLRSEDFMDHEVEAKADDYPTLFGKEHEHEHLCLMCMPGHPWPHEDDDCGCTQVLACPEVRARLKG